MGWEADILHEEAAASGCPCDAGKGRLQSVVNAEPARGFPGAAAAASSPSLQRD